ncbi:SPOR domain-containing protein [uncultured Hymenobacter sp.]|uniref:HU domain-containing protein n=1 Tax=uncultured Hymenobacter sp. TaxID=170016 RepID=UPI0035CB5FAD
MHLADHIRPLLQDHDCVIIPDFGGLVAEPVPARLSAARLHLGPPAKQVAFNQALTRNDGLLVDALSQYLRIPATQAREVLRHAVEDMHQELREGQRTELPGIGVFRQAPGRGLRFDYTGTANLLPAAFGLPALSVHPVLATDARLAREKRPALLLQAATRRPAARRGRLARLLTGVGAGVATGLLVLAGISYFPGSTASPQPAERLTVAAVAASAPEPQQATLAHNGWSSTAAAIPTPPAPAEAATEPDAADFDPAKVAALTRPEVPAAAVADKAPALSAKPSSGAVRVAKPAASARWSAAGRRAKALLVRRPTPPVIRKALLTPAATAPTVPAAAPAVAAATTVKRPSGRSYVVAGAFDSQAGAEACRRNLVRAGFAGAKVLTPNRTTRRFRATVADYADLPSARRAAARLRFQRKTFFDVYSY